MDIDENKPYTANYPPLDAWLKEHATACHWQLPRGPKNKPLSMVECWQVGDRQVIIVVHAGRRGWEIYSSLNCNAIDASLLDALERCQAPEAPSPTKRAPSPLPAAAGTPSPPAGDPAIVRKIGRVTMTVTARNPRPCECDKLAAAEGAVDVDLSVSFTGRGRGGEADLAELLWGGATLRREVMESLPVQFAWVPWSGNLDEWISHEIVMGVRALARVADDVSPNSCWDACLEAARLALAGYVPA